MNSLDTHETTRSRSSLLVLLPLLTLLVLQLLWLVFSHLRGQQLRGPRVGAQVHNIALRSVQDNHFTSLQELVSNEGHCLLVVFVRPSCPTCKFMRMSWISDWDRWQKYAGRQLRYIWVGDVSATSLREFITDQQIDQSRVYVAEFASNEEWGILGVWGTPTSYLIDTSLRELYGAIGYNFPSYDLVRSQCR